MISGMKIKYKHAFLLEKILLGWWVWAFIALILNSAAPGMGSVVLFPIMLPLSLFLAEDSLTQAMGMFMSFSWLALIVGGVLNSMRKRNIFIHEPNT
jgi:hypothetical protein